MCQWKASRYRKQVSVAEKDSSSRNGKQVSVAEKDYLLLKTESNGKQVSVTEKTSRYWKQVSVSEKERIVAKESRSLCQKRTSRNWKQVSVSEKGQSLKIAGHSVRKRLVGTENSKKVGCHWKLVTVSEKGTTENRLVKNNFRKHEWFSGICLPGMLVIRVRFLLAEIMETHRIIDDTMENSIKGRRKGDNLR